MTRIFRHTAASAAFVLSVFSLTACTPPSYINTENLGTPVVSEAEITRLIAGNSFRGGDRYAYHGADGALKYVADDSSWIVTGSWRVHTVLGSSKLCEETTEHGLQNGKTQSRGPYQACYVVYLKPDGSLALDKMGGSNFSYGKPIKGFLKKTQFEATRRKLGVPL